MRRARVSLDLDRLPEGIGADEYDRNLDEGWPYADLDETNAAVPAAARSRRRRRRRRARRERAVSDAGGA